MPGNTSPQALRFAVSPYTEQDNTKEKQMQNSRMDTGERALTAGHLTAAAKNAALATLVAQYPPHASGDGPQQGLTPEVRVANARLTVDIPGGLEPQVKLRLTVNETFQATMLMGDLCQALSAGNAQLVSPELGCTSWAKASHNYVMPYCAGQEVDVFRAKTTPSWSLLAARPRQAPKGPAYEAFSLYVKDPVLAERLTAQIRDGSLRAAPRVQSSRQLMELRA